MKLLLAIFFVHALILLGNPPTSASSSQNSSTRPQAHKSPAKQSPASKDKVGSGRNGKPDQPEAAPNQQTQPSVTINAIPPLTVNSKRDWMDCATLIIGISLVLVGAATGGLIWYQAIQTKVAAVAAKNSAEAFINSERAWLVIKPELPEGLHPAPPHGLTRFKWSIKNVGKTPARISETDARAGLADLKTLPREPRYVGDPLAMNDFLLVPNDSIPITWMTEEPLSLDDVKQVKNGLGQALLAYGFVRYRDTFNQPHIARFCHTYRVYEDTGKEGFEPYTDAPKAYSECD